MNRLFGLLILALVIAGCSTTTAPKQTASINPSAILGTWGGTDQYRDTVVFVVQQYDSTTQTYSSTTPSYYYGVMTTDGNLYMQSGQVVPSTGLANNPDAIPNGFHFVFKYAYLNGVDFAFFDLATNDAGNTLNGTVVDVVGIPVRVTLTRLH